MQYEDNKGEAGPDRVDGAVEARHKADFEGEDGGDGNQEVGADGLADQVVEEDLLLHVLVDPVELLPLQLARHQPAQEQHENRNEGEHAEHEHEPQVLGDFDGLLASDFGKPLLDLGWEGGLGFGFTPGRADDQIKESSDRENLEGSHVHNGSAESEGIGWVRNIGKREIGHYLQSCHHSPNEL